MGNKDNFPRYLSIQTTSFCNASCIFCPYTEIKDRFPPRIMEEDLYRKIIDEAARHPNVERLILYMNNEPLTDPHLVERINYAKEKVPWASVHILTNGRSLTEELAEKLVRSKLDWIGISLHGIRKDTLEKTMGIDPELTIGRVLKFLDKAKKHRNLKDFVMITFLGHRFLTADEKEETFRFWNDHGIERISYFARPISRAGNVKSLPAAVHEKISGCKSIWANEMMHIVETGEVVLCCMDWRREVILGDLNKQGIEEVWCSERYAEAREKRDGQRASEANFICKRCEESIVRGEGHETDPGQAPGEDKAAPNPAAGDEPSGIALVMAPPWQTRMPPLGLAYLSSFLRSNGIKTRVIDLNVKLFNKSGAEKKYLWDIETINSFKAEKFGECFYSEFSREMECFVDEIAHAKETVIGFSTTIASVYVAVHVAKKIKEKAPSKIIILGGPGVFWETRLVDPEGVIDIFVIGEGELPLLEIIRRFQKNRALSGLLGIPGTIVCFENQWHSFAAPDPLKNIDAIPSADFSEFDLNEYSVQSGHRSRPLPLLISRGCVNHCSFCIDHKMNRPFRTRDPHKVVEELKYYIQRYGVHDFELNDLLCNGNLKQLGEICDLIIKEKLPLQWTSYATIRPGMTPEIFRKMKEAGCRKLCYGMESASDVVLKKMGKAYDSRIAEQVLRDTHGAEISTAINIIIGHPGESEKEFRKTFGFIKRNKPYIDEITNVSTCFLMLETDLEKNLDKYGIYFKFKRSFKERVKMFLGRDVGPGDKRRLYRQFYVRPDNTPRARAMWLRRMLSLIHKLKIPCAVVNRVTEDDVSFNKFFQTKILRSSLPERTGLIKVCPEPERRTIHIFFKDQKVTADVGLNTSFLVNGKWFDSSGRKWEIERRAGQLFMKIFFQEISISQEWTMRTRKNSLSWEIRTFFHDDLVVAQQKTGIAFSDQYHQYTADGASLDFPAVGESWNEVDLLRSDRAELVSKAGLPKMNFCLERRPKDNAFIQLQNFPASFSARMINFCLLTPPAPRGHVQEERFFKKGDTTKNNFKLTLGQK